MTRKARIVAFGILTILLLAVPALAHHTSRLDTRIVEPYGVQVVYHQPIVAGYEVVPSPIPCGVGATAPAGAIYTESFEGAHAWTFEGTPLAAPRGNYKATNLWHTSTFAGPGADTGHSGPSRLWFANPTTKNFNVGHVAGSARSPAIELPMSPAVLTWAEKWQTETLRGYDHLFVEILDAEGKIHVLCHSNSQVRVDPDGVGGGSYQTSCSPNILAACGTRDGTVITPMGWMTRAIELPPTLAGTTVQVQFTFDSSDPAANWFMGWMVDDVQVLAVG